LTSFASAVLLRSLKKLSSGDSDSGEGIFADWVFGVKCKAVFGIQSDSPWISTLGANPSNGRNALFYYQELDFVLAKRAYEASREGTIKAESNVGCYRAGFQASLSDACGEREAEAKLFQRIR
jgi:hypothetical protein